MEADNHARTTCKEKRLFLKLSSKRRIRDFFYHLVFEPGTDVFLKFLDINVGKLPGRRLVKHPSADLIFQKVVLLKLGKDSVELVGRDLVVVQSIGEKPVDGVALGNGEGGDLLVLLDLRVELFAGENQRRRNESEAPTSAAKRNGSGQANHRQSGAKTCAGKRCRENAGASGAPINELSGAFVFFRDEAIVVDLAGQCVGNLIELLQAEILRRLCHHHRI